VSLRYDPVFLDCNSNGIEDLADVVEGAVDDDLDGVLDECEFARGDFDLDGMVGGADLATLLSLWGTVNAPFGDFDGDGMIAGADLAIFLGNWGAY